MTSILKRILGRDSEASSKKKKLIIIEDDNLSDVPYVASTIFYLAVVLFIGLPMWFYTCSKTRYSLPDLTRLESKLSDPNTRLHLDISLIQLSSYDALKNDEDFDHSDDQQTIYFRKNLPTYFNTSIENVAYNINWRVRRPTHDEFRIFQQHQKSHPTSGYQGSAELVNLEENLIKLHKPGNKFRLFMYLIDESHYAAFCDPSRPHTFTISFERFVYLCPSTALTTSDNHAPGLNLINRVIDEVYANTVDSSKIKHILKAQIDLLFSLIPETIGKADIEYLSSLADKLHEIYQKNVLDRYPELKELVNISLITQNIVDLINGQLDDKVTKQGLAATNKTSNETSDEIRMFQLDKIDQLFHDFESRLNKHSSQHVQNVLTIVPSPARSRILFKRSLGTAISFLEGKDMNSMLVANDDKSIVLGLRAIVRRTAGLSSVNICDSCLVRRNVFFNRWEFDAIMGSLTMIKLQNVLLSLKSVSRQAIGIKIPKDVAAMADEAHHLASKSVEHLETKRVLESYRLASQAYRLSELVYYNPSLLESLYFPDDLKYAIYSPLFFPMAVPFIASIMRLVKFILGKRKLDQKAKIN